MWSSPIVAVDLLQEITSTRWSHQVKFLSKGRVQSSHVSTLCSRVPYEYQNLGSIFLTVGRRGRVPRLSHDAKKQPFHARISVRHLISFKKLLNGKARIEHCSGWRQTTDSRWGKANHGEKWRSGPDPDLNFWRYESGKRTVPQSIKILKQRSGPWWRE